LEFIATGKLDAVVALDTQGLVLNEYTPYVNYHGQPGVGDQFFKFLHDHMHIGERVVLVAITPIQDDCRSFEELPTNKLDPSDRKFLAIALSSGAEIVNALDTDWYEQKGLLAGLGVEVRQLCPEQGCVI
jgi:predicted nucleic acid-binding protein